MQSAKPKVAKWRKNLMIFEKYFESQKPKCQTTGTLALHFSHHGKF